MSDTDIRKYYHAVSRAALVARVWASTAGHAPVSYQEATVGAAGAVSVARRMPMSYHEKTVEGHGRGESLALGPADEWYLFTPPIIGHSFLVRKTIATALRTNANTALNALARAVATCFTGVGITISGTALHTTAAMRGCSIGAKATAGRTAVARD